MKKLYRNYIYLVIWIFVLVCVGSAIGSLTASEISSWYNSLQRSTLTPPNYMFPIVWTILYILIAISGWIIWQRTTSNNMRRIKSLYVMQLLLNWSWTPLFFCFHLTGLSLLILLIMDVLVALIIYLTYEKISSVAWLMMPYLLWIILASYLNFYIWQYN